MALRFARRSSDLSCRSRAEQQELPPRFPVPEAAVTIADRISQKSHLDWTRAFLVSHREVRSVEPHREVRSAEQHQRPGDR